MGIFNSIFEPPFKRRRDGSYSVNLSEDELNLLDGLADQLRDLLSTDSSSLRRLFPPPYEDDDERNEGYSALAGSELVERRLAALDLLQQTMHAESLEEDDLLAWMRCVNDIRLVLGTTLDVTEEGHSPEQDDPQYPMFAAYEYLGMLLERMVRSASA